VRQLFVAWCAVLVLPLTVGCTFNFDVTSQRTALENQVMGSYKELDDDLILASSVRGLSKNAVPTAAKVSASKQRAFDARQNQQFNQDDIEEFKQKQILGEAADGSLVLLPRGVAKTAQPAPKDYKLAQQIAAEENRDRQVIWHRIIDANEHLSEKDLPNVRLTYAKMLQGTATAGAWYQDSRQTWVQKPTSRASEL